MVIIRDAVKEDLKSLAGLSKQLGYPNAGKIPADHLSMILASREHGVLAACTEEGRVIGWVHVFIALRVESAPFAEIGGFVVDEEYRGKGIGARLLDAAETWTRQNGILKLRVRSQSHRLDAHRFYERFGFSKSKEQFVYDKPIY